MKTFILLTKLSQEITKQIIDRAQIGRSWLNYAKDKSSDAIFISHYAPYNLLDIYRAPDEKTAAKVSIISLNNGAFGLQNLIAILYKNF